MKLISYLLIILILLVSSCQKQTEQKIDENLKFRIDSLYEHTLLMGEYSTPEVLDKICLDISKIENSKTLTSEEKIIQMAYAFNVTVQGNYEKQLKSLEDRMASMMDYWNEAQEENAQKRCY